MTDSAPDDLTPDDLAADDVTADDVQEESPELFELARVVTISGPLKRRLQEARLQLEQLRSRLEEAQKQEEESNEAEDSPEGEPDDQAMEEGTDDGPTKEDENPLEEEETPQDEEQTLQEEDDPPTPEQVAEAAETVEHLTALDHHGELLRRRRRLFLAAEAAAHLPRHDPASPGAVMARRLQDNLTVVLQHGHSLHKVRALRALHHVATVDCLPALEGALRDESPWVQATALRTFLSLDLEKADPRRALRRFLWRAFGASFQSENPQGAFFFHLLSGVVTGIRRQKGGYVILGLALILGLVRGVFQLLVWGCRAVLVLLAILFFGGAWTLVAILLESLWEWITGFGSALWTRLAQGFHFTVDGAGTLLIWLLLALFVLAPLGQLKLPWKAGAKVWGTALVRSLGGLTLDGFLLALAWLQADQLHLWPVIVFILCHLLILFIDDDLDIAKRHSPRWVGRGVLLGSLAYYQGCSPLYGWWLFAVMLHAVPIWWAHWPNGRRSWGQRLASLLVFIGMGVVLALMPMIFDLLMWTVIGGLVFGLSSWIYHVGSNQVTGLRTYLLARHPRHFASRHHFIAYILWVAQDQRLSAASRSRSVRRLLQLPLADSQVVARLMELASEPELPPTVRDAAYQVVDTIERRIQQGQSTPISDALELPARPRLPATAPMLRRPMGWFLVMTLSVLVFITSLVSWLRHLEGHAFALGVPLGLAWTALAMLLLCTLTVGHAVAWRRATWILGVGTLTSLLGRGAQVWPFETQEASLWPSLCIDSPFLVDWATLASLLVGVALFFLGALLGDVIYGLEGDHTEGPPASLGTAGWALLALLSGGVVVLQSVPLESYFELRRQGPIPQVTAANKDGSRWWVDLGTLEPHAVRMAVLDLPSGIDELHRLETFPWADRGPWEESDSTESDAEWDGHVLAASWFAVTPYGTTVLVDEGCWVSAVAAASVVQLDLKSCPPARGHHHLVVQVLGPHRTRFLMEQAESLVYERLPERHRRHGELSTMVDHLIWFPLQPETSKCCKSI